MSLLKISIINQLQVVIGPCPPPSPPVPSGPNPLLLLAPEYFSSVSSCVLSVPESESFLYRVLIPAIVLVNKARKSGPPKTIASRSSYKPSSIADTTESLASLNPYMCWSASTVALLVIITPLYGLWRREVLVFLFGFFCIVSFVRAIRILFCFINY